jgi:hypothetical protein
MGERLDEILEYARDPDALIAALSDLDDAVAARTQARRQQDADPENRTVSNRDIGDGGREVEAAKRPPVTA